MNVNPTQLPEDSEYKRSALGPARFLWDPDSNAAVTDGPETLEDEPEMLLQPETRPISHEQLVVEVKGIYAGLVMVEAKCIDIDERQSLAAQQKDLGKRVGLKNDQWQSLIALHKQLLHEHHAFFLASQHPSASPALSHLAAKYSMPARMWRHGIHAFLEVLRHRPPESLEHMLAFIYMTYSMMALLFETIPPFEDTCVECLGDLGRYRVAIEDDELDDREVWSNVARFWYKKASDNSPRVGRPYHHLASLARPLTLDQLSLYTRCLMHTTPLESARASIISLLNPISQGDGDVHRRAGFLIPHEGLDRPVPEDFVIRGRPYTREDFPNTFFTNAMIDDDERSLETLLLNEPRLERICWLGRRIAEVGISIDFRKPPLTLTQPNRSIEIHTRAQSCARRIHARDVSCIAFDQFAVQHEQAPNVPQFPTTQLRLPPTGPIHGICNLVLAEPHQEANLWNSITLGAETHRLLIDVLLRILNALKNIEISLSKAKMTMRQRISKASISGACTHRALLLAVYANFLVPASARTIPEHRVLPRTESQSNFMSSIFADAAYLLAGVPWLLFLGLILSAGHALASIKGLIPVWVTFMTIWSLAWPIIKIDASTTLGLSARCVTPTCSWHSSLTLCIACPYSGLIPHSNTAKQPSESYR